MKLIVLSLSFILMQTVLAKNKLDLEDLEIKGELLNDDRLNIIGRDRNELKNYVKFRTNYRTEMVEGLPTPAPKSME